LTVRTTLRQALKFGVSGILGAAISASLYYGYRGSLPAIYVTVWIFQSVNATELSLYMLASVVGGSVHFALSKVWVFVDERVRVAARRVRVAFR
jgi:putative flippase GtrA